jgi:hypothetical protein
MSDGADAFARAFGTDRSVTVDGAFDGGAEASHPARTVAPDTAAYDFQVINTALF